MSNPDPTIHGSETCLVLVIGLVIILVAGVVGLMLDAYQ